jgi:hypothetical protein
MRLACRRSKPLDLNACLAPSFLHRFCGATDRPKSGWFWGSNQKTVTMILRLKSPNRSCQFWGRNQETWAIGFEVKIEKIVLVVLRPNHWQTVDLDFEAQSRNLHFPSPRARCRPRIAPPYLSIARPPSIRPVWPSSILCTRSSTPTMILIAARHITSATYTTRKANTILYMIQR